MSEEKLGGEPAFAAACESISGYEWQNGMSKRFYAACAAMQGMLANPYPDIVRLDTDALIRASYSMADQLLRQENE